MKWTRIHHRTDSGNAERLIDAFGDQLRYCQEHDGWHIYDGTQWLSDKTLEIEHLAGEALRRIYFEAAQAPDEKREKLAKWAIASEAAAKRRADRRACPVDPRVAVRADVFDHDPWLLNCANGTLDLYSGELRPHDPHDLISKIVPVAYDPTARADLWRAGLEETTGGDVDLNDSAAGLRLRPDGRATEEVFFVLLGGTETGKSTVTNAVGQTLGGYAATSRSTRS